MSRADRGDRERAGARAPKTGGSVSALVGSSRAGRQAGRLTEARRKLTWRAAAKAVVEGRRWRVRVPRVGLGKTECRQAGRSTACAGARAGGRRRRATHARQGRGEQSRPGQGRARGGAAGGSPRVERGVRACFAEGARGEARAELERQGERVGGGRSCWDLGRQGRWRGTGRCELAAERVEGAWLLVKGSDAAEESCDGPVRRGRSEWSPSAPYCARRCFSCARAGS